MLNKQQQIADRLATEQPFVGESPEDYDGELLVPASDPAHTDVAETVLGADELSALHLVPDEKQPAQPNRRYHKGVASAALVAVAFTSLGVAIKMTYDYYNPTEIGLQDPSELAKLVPDTVQTPDSSPTPNSITQTDPSPESTELQPPTAAEIIAESQFQPVERSAITGISVVGLVSGVHIESDADVNAGIVRTRPDGTQWLYTNGPRDDMAYVLSQGTKELGVVWDETTVDSPDDYTVQTERHELGEEPDPRPVIIHGHAGLGIGIFANLHKMQAGDLLIVETGEGKFLYEMESLYEAPKGQAGADDPNSPIANPEMNPAVAYMVGCIPDGYRGASDTSAVITLRLSASLSYEGHDDSTAVPTNAEFLSGNIS